MDFFFFGCFLILHKTYFALKTRKKIDTISYQTHEEAKNQSGNDKKDIRTPSRNSEGHCEIVVKMLK
jgi:hypothetical protein